MFRSMNNIFTVITEIPQRKDSQKDKPGSTSRKSKAWTECSSKLCLPAGGDSYSAQTSNIKPHFSLKVL